MCRQQKELERSRLACVAGRYTREGIASIAGCRAGERTRPQADENPKVNMVCRGCLQPYRGMQNIQFVFVVLFRQKKCNLFREAGPVG